MKNRVKIGLAVLVGLLMAAGLILAGCGAGECIGTGNCIVTVDQGTSGLYVDNDEARSSCGDQAEYDYENSRYVGGCKVQNNIAKINMRAGTHECDCAGG